MAPVADYDALWLGIVGVLVTLTWVYPWLRSVFRAASDEHPVRPRYQNIRGAFLASMLMVGLVRIFVGSFVRAFPTVRWLELSQDALAPVLTLLLLSGGIVMTVLWILEDRDRRRGHG